MLKLSEQEKAEILRYLNENKELPEKYRFLLFGDKQEIELVWREKSNEVCNVVLPFQIIENIDEPRAEKVEAPQLDFSCDTRGRQLQGWTNKLIWGDNKLILSSLKNGALREEIEEQGGIKLIYIDPPFDVGADFSMDIEIGDDTFTKKPNILEEIAYRDTWGKGADSFIAMIYERLVLMRDLLAENGSIYVHCDWRVNSYLRLVLDEVFGRDNFRNEILTRRAQTKNLQGQFAGIKTLNIFSDTIFWYSKNQDTRFKPPMKEATNAQQQESWQSLWNNANRPTMRYEILGKNISSGQWKWSKERANKAVENYKNYECQVSHHTLYEYWVDNSKKLEFIRRRGTAKPQYWIPPRKKVIADSNWFDIKAYNYSNNYPTEKSENLLERIIKASSNKGDLVADFFCGSGTTAAVAEKLGRQWIASDLGKFAIHTTRKRMIGVQRELKKADSNYRAFEILNLGKYERQRYLEVNPNLREQEQQKQLQTKEQDFVKLILCAYRAEAITNHSHFQGKKNQRFIAVGPINLQVTRALVAEIIAVCCTERITKVDILGFEFEMGLFPNLIDEARSKGIDLAPKYIPVEVFDQKAVANNQVVFYNVAYIEAEAIINQEKEQKPTIKLQLTNFSVFYSQDAKAYTEQTLKKNSAKIVVDEGQVVKLSKDYDGKITRDILTKKWTDWIDYWSVDFDFESKREMIRVQNSNSGEWEEQWSGEYVFENEWQSFRSKKNRTLELTSIAHECQTGTRKIAVKVIDIFGNDTMRIVKVKV